MVSYVQPECHLEEAEEQDHGSDSKFCMKEVVFNQLSRSKVTEFDLF